MNGFTYTLILEEPVLANSLSGDTNSARSLPFIPGGLVRGALVPAYLKSKGLNEIKADNTEYGEFSRLFLKNSTRFLHAYPVCNDKRMLPTPLAWKEYKDQQAGVIQNFAHTIKTDPTLKNASFPFYVLNGGKVARAKHEWQVNVHTQRDAVYGRAKGEGQGAVFRYEALPAGLHLEGMILAGDKTDADILKQMLPEYIMLGKARTAGYGRARIKIGKDIDDAWREDDSSPLSNNKATHFILTFLSNAILRDANGQATLDPLPALKAVLGANDLQIKNTFHSSEIVGGFNRQWGLPLPQSQVLGAGSVLVVESASGVEKEALAKLERSGLGERKAEGFGRVAVSVNPQKHFDLETGKLKFETKAPASLIPAEEPVADLMLKRLLRRELDEKVLSAVINAVSGYKGGVKNSQLSRWRVNLRSAIHAKKGMEDIREFYKKEDSRNSPSWQKMTRARINIKIMTKDEKEEEILKGIDRRLTEWLDGLTQDQSKIWNMLGYFGTEKPTKNIETRKLEADKEFEVEYSLRLMDAVMASMTKKNAEGGDNG